jgi:hypothetical protein
MTITYAGPNIAPTFVAGVINDAWSKAADLITTARATASDLSPGAITPASLATVTTAPTFAESLPAIPAAGSVADFESALTTTLATWIDEHFPDTADPDAAAAWARVVATFTGSEQTTEIGLAASRIATVLDGFPTETISAVSDQLAADATRVSDGVTRNRQMIDYAHRKAIDIAGFDVVMRTQLEALDAARGFVIDAVLGLATKQAQELSRVATAKQRLQGAYFEHLGARAQAYGVEVDRTALGKRIDAAADVAAKERNVFIFRERAAAAVAQLESLASQASGAINRAGASASVSGGETSP